MISLLKLSNFDVYRLASQSLIPHKKKLRLLTAPQPSLGAEPWLVTRQVAGAMVVAVASLAMAETSGLPAQSFTVLWQWFQ